MPLMMDVGTLRVEDGRASGMRTFHPLLLDKVASRMDALHMEECTIAARAIRAWLNSDTKPNGKSALEGAVAKLEALEADERKHGNDKEASYLEVARFCVQAHLK